MTYSILITLIGANKNYRMARVLGAVEERSTNVNDCSRMKDGGAIIIKPSRTIWRKVESVELCMYYGIR